MGEQFREGGPRPPRRNNFHNEVPRIIEEIVSIEEKVFFPIQKYPGYNFVGRLLGQKGSNLKELVQSTKTRISILGKGSSKDRSKESELLKSDDPEHAHLKEPIHVLIVAKGKKFEAHRRMAHALRELCHFMVPGDDRPHPGEEHEERGPPPTAFERGDDRRHPEQRGPPGGVIRGAPGGPPGGMMNEVESMRGEVRRGREPHGGGDPYAEDRYYEPRGPRGGGGGGGERYGPQDGPPPRDGPRGYNDYPEERRPPREAANGYPQKQRYKEDPYARGDPYAR